MEGGGAVRGGEAANVAGPTVERERCVDVVDTRVVLALNWLGTARHEQAVIGLIQAKTATELARSTAPVAVPSARPRIRDGGTPTISRQVAAADPERS